MMVFGRVLEGSKIGRCRGVIYGIGVELLGWVIIGIFGRDGFRICLVFLGFSSGFC